MGQKLGILRVDENGYLVLNLIRKEVEEGHNSKNLPFLKKKFLVERFRRLLPEDDRGKYLYDLNIDQINLAHVCELMDKSYGDQNQTLANFLRFYFKINFNMESPYYEGNRVSEVLWKKIVPNCTTLGQFLEAIIVYHGFSFQLFSEFLGIFDLDQKIADNLAENY